MELPKPVLTLQHWHKTQEGAAVIAMESYFVLQGTIYQGYKGAIAECAESSMTDKELKEALDIDGTKDKVYFRRHQRLGSRHDRKANEYAKRRATLRHDRNEIRDSMLKDEAAGLPANPADAHDMAEIDKRMSRLILLTDAETYDADGVKAADDPVETAAEIPDEPPISAGECDICQKPCPPGRELSVWLRGHKMGAHSRKKK